LSGNNQNGRPARSYGVVTATSIVVANMIGAGIFTTSGIMAGQLPGTGWVILCWLFGGLIAMSGALCYAELASRMPESGGEYIYLRDLYHPSLGFLTGWTSFIVGFSAPIALSALGFSEYLFGGMKGLFPSQLPETITVQKKMIGVLIIALFAFIHYLGQKIGAKVQNLLTGLKIVIILGLVFAGFALGSADWSWLSLSKGSGGGSFALGSAMILVMYSYSGWNATGYITGELKRPRRTIPVSLIGGTGIVIILYLLMNLFIFHAAPYDILKGKVAVVEVAAVGAFGGWIAGFVSGLISILLLSSLSAYLIIGPRIYHSMAKDRMFFRFASKVHPRYSVPGRAILIQGALASVMVIFGTFEQLLLYIGFALGIFPWLAVAGIFIARKKKVGEKSAVKVFAYPIVPAFFLISSLALMTTAFINRPLESSIAILTVLCGIPVYYLWKREKQR